MVVIFEIVNNTLKNVNYKTLFLVNQLKIMSKFSILTVAIPQ